MPEWTADVEARLRTYGRQLGLVSERDVKAALAEIARLTAQLEAERTNNESHRSTLAFAVSQVNQLRDQLAAERLHADQIHTGCHAERDELVAKFERANQDWETLDREVDRAELALDLAIGRKSERESISARVKLLVADRDRLAHELDHARAGLGQMTNRIAELDGRCSLCFGFDPFAVPFHICPSELKRRVDHRGLLPQGGAAGDGNG